MDGDHCVLKCSRPGTQQIRNQCVQCPPSGCLKCRLLFLKSIYGL